MMTIKPTFVRIIIFTFPIIFLIFMASCTTQSTAENATLLTTNTRVPPTVIPPTPTPPSRPILSANEVKMIAAELKRVSIGYIDAYNKHDLALMSQLLSNDVKYYEVSSTPDAFGINQYVSSFGSFLADNPNFACRQLDNFFISRENGFDTIETWNWGGSTADEPYLGYDWYILEDGKISSLYVFWGPDFFSRYVLPLYGGDFSQNPLEDYASSWSSGDPETVVNLYDPGVIRQDALFEENQKDSSSVKDFVIDFFTWYPGVRFKLLQPFKLGMSIPEIIGGVYAIHTSDQDGKPCVVKSIIVLELSQDKITKEWVFYNADSLIACGWAQ